MFHIAYACVVDPLAHVRRTIVPYEDFPCSTVAFDYTGLYLGVGGADARVYGQKQVRSGCGAHSMHTLCQRRGDNYVHVAGPGIVHEFLEIQRINMVVSPSLRYNG